MATVLVLVEVGLGIAVACLAWLAIDGGAEFAAYSAFAAACLWLVERLRLRWEIRHKPSEPRQFTISTSQDGGSSGAPNVVPDNWQGIVPPQSRYKFETETTDSIPLGLQSFSFEYGPQGHGKALTLKGAIVRAEIQFTCRIVNSYKAIYGANEYALNVLQPRFLSHARGILERFSLTRLRAGRHEVARDIVAQLSPQFEELGVRLESVTIGALDQIEKAKKIIVNKLNGGAATTCRRQPAADGCRVTGIPTATFLGSTRGTLKMPVRAIKQLRRDDGLYLLSAS